MTEWISVTDRLPDDENPVLLTTAPKTCAKSLKISFSPELPATHDYAGFEVLTFTEIGEITQLPNAPQTPDN